jgi:DNA-binding NarL/FixJ family response regulator
VLLDLEMPVMDGFETLKVLTKEYPDIKTIIFSSHYNEFYISELILHGARGYISKTAFAEEVFRTIQHVYDEGFCFNKAITGHIMQTLIEDRKLQDLISNRQLTSREIEVLQQICNEKQNKEIAFALRISESTVEFHKKNIYHKTNTHSVVGLVKYALKAGITSIV